MQIAHYTGRNPTKRNPLTGGEKVGIALGVAGIVGIIAYALYSTSQTAQNAAGAAFPTASMTPAASASGGTALTTACAPGTQVYLYDSAGNKYSGSISACQSTSGQSFATVSIPASGVPSGATTLTANTYVNVPYAYLSST
jgi:hypothetical protein